ncbi:unnamed protein product [Schistocephalus solidus]|uniref:Protocadherin-9 n=1 Tax=Schistocephalus solidus TaxID=70667 RepID=A0A183SJ01_SCHSO|nr:unnamed protein product [Schistocephalus solidus]
MRNTVSVSFSVTEECPEGTLVGQLGSAFIHNNPQFPSVDPTLNAGRRSEIRYQLLTRTEIFRLDEFSGAIFTNDRLDRETLCIEKQSVHRSESPSQEVSSRHRESPDLPCFINLQILQLGDLLQPLVIHKDQIAEPVTKEPTVILVRIFILDINDNAPSWTDSEINISVPEHTPPGTQFALPLAHDADCGPENTTVRYFIFKPLTDIAYKMRDYDMHQFFQLDTELNDPFDRDRHASFADSRWSADVINRGAPPIVTCVSPSFRLWLRILGDIDYETSETLQTLQSKQYAMFSLHSAKRIQDQVKPAYSFILVAVDGGRPVPKTGTVVVNVNVKDINDHPPVFLPPDSSSSSSSSSKGSIYTRVKTQQPLQPDSVFIEIQENAPVGEIIYVPKIFEPDATDQASLMFDFESSIDTSAKTLFGIHPKTGAVQLRGSPDYEKHISFLLPIRVSDGKHTAHQNLHVEILNLNDNAPVITVRPLFVAENELPGQFLASVSISDEDQQTGSPGLLDREDNVPAGLPGSDMINAFYCQLSHDGLRLEPLFHGAFDQFKLLTRISFDREQTPEQLLTLTCADSGQPRQSSQVGIELIVLDRNDNSPLIKNQPLMASVRENSPPERRIFRVEASDADIGKNAALQYALSGEGADKFRINSKTGEIFTVETFDRESTARFKLIVTVKDGRTNNTLHVADTEPDEPVKETTAMLTIEVQDENDCVPTFYQQLYQFSVEENAGMNTLVGELKAKDEDVMPENHKVTNGLYLVSLL